MFLKTVSSAILALSLSSLAYADQCQVVDRSQALSFLKLVKVGDYVGSLCEPCGEEPTEAGGPYFQEVTALELRQWQEPGLYEVFVNGKSVDLAYTYVRTGQSDNASVVVNAAFLVGCKAQRVTNRFLID